MNTTQFARRLWGMLQHGECSDDSLLKEDVGLFDDWALDSLQAFQMIVAIEAMADCPVPPVSMPQIFTVGDAYKYYLLVLDLRDSDQ